MAARWHAHVTVAAIVQREDRFLIVEEASPHGVRLNQPAGHLEAGESLIEAAVRETLEETGRLFTPTALLGVYMGRYRALRTGDDETYVRIALIGSVGERDPARVLDDGVLDTCWLTAETLRARASAHRSALVQRCVDDALSGRRLPLDALYADASVYEEMTP